MLKSCYRYLIDNEELNKQGYFKSLSLRQSMRFSSKDPLLKLAYLSLIQQIYELNQN